MCTSKSIYAPDVNLDYLALTLTAWYRNEQFVVERSNICTGAV